MVPTDLNSLFQRFKQIDENVLKREGKDFDFIEVHPLIVEIFKNVRTFEKVLKKHTNFWNLLPLTKQTTIKNHLERFLGFIKEIEDFDSSGVNPADRKNAIADGIRSSYGEIFDVLISQLKSHILSSELATEKNKFKELSDEVGGLHVVHNRTTKQLGIVSVIAFIILVFTLALFIWKPVLNELLRPMSVFIPSLFICTLVIILLWKKWKKWAEPALRMVIFFSTALAILFLLLQFSEHFFSPIQSFFHPPVEITTVTNTTTTATGFTVATTTARALSPIEVVDNDTAMTILSILLSFAALVGTGMYFFIRDKVLKEAEQERSFSRKEIEQERSFSRAEICMNTAFALWNVYNQTLVKDQKLLDTIIEKTTRGMKIINRLNESTRNEREYAICRYKNDLVYYLTTRGAEDDKEMIKAYIKELMDKKQKYPYFAKDMIDTCVSARDKFPELGIVCDR